MEGYQYADSQNDNDVPDVQSYHNLTWNKKGRFPAQRLSVSGGLRLGLYLRQRADLLGNRRDEPLVPAGLRGRREGDQLLRLVVVEQIRWIDGTDRIASFNVSVPFSLFTRRAIAGTARLTAPTLRHPPVETAMATQAGKPASAERCWRTAT